VTRRRDPDRVLPGRQVESVRRTLTRGPSRLAVERDLRVERHRLDDEQAGYGRTQRAGGHVGAHRHTERADGDCPAAGTDRDEAAAHYSECETTGGGQAWRGEDDESDEERDYASGRHGSSSQSVEMARYKCHAYRPIILAPQQYHLPSRRKIPEKAPTPRLPSTPSTAAVELVLRRTVLRKHATAAMNLP